jgi:hypothetical protein
MSEGDPIMSSGFLSSPRDIRTWEKIFAGEEITLIGFPQSGAARTGAGSYIFPSGRFAVMEKAREKQGAWEFIKHTLNYYADTGIPVKISNIEKLMDEAKKNIGGKEYAIHIAAEKPYSDDFIFMKSGGSEPSKAGAALSFNEITVGNNTDEDNEKFMDFIKSVSGIRKLDRTISNIIQEEVDYYLAGQKSADEIMDIIENRINLYISETG